MLTSWHKSGYLAETNGQVEIAPRVSSKGALKLARNAEAPDST
jgi:hypothetical protein